MESTGATNALTRPRTARSLDGYRSGARVRAVAGVALAAVSGLVELTGLLPHKVTASGAGLGTALFASGLVLLWHSRRLRRTLAAGPWRAAASVFVTRSAAAPAVVLSDPESGELTVLAVHSVRRRYRVVNRDELWWARDPDSAGFVIAPEGGGELIWAKPVWTARSRARLAAKAESVGLLERTATAPRA
ncbi:hypothetical protein [Streptomyces sp. NPDC000410]|uniref:hypothetical protein n=1 Tax=Streptomyces sp. NPDC000410 TaxID=3154254 RepID=UPI0033293E2A